MSHSCKSQEYQHNIIIRQNLYEVPLCSHCTVLSFVISACAAQLSASFPKPSLKLLL